jgi:hypothetical protein
MDFYHATYPSNIESIYSKGFRLPFVYDDDGSRLKVEGCVGHGIYISRSWKTALWFNRALLRVQLRDGASILDVSDTPNMKVIDSLRREFGKELLSDKATFHKSIPSNKYLKCSELIELTKYHYHRTWGQGERKRLHGKSLIQCWSMLRRYKYDGFGHSTSDIGIMVMSPDKIIIKELVAVVRDRPFDRGERQFESIDDLRKYFKINGEKEYIELAEQIIPADG